AAFAQTAPTAPAPAAAAKAPAAVTAPAAPAATATPAVKTDDAARGGKFRAACGADIAKLCGDVKPIANATPDQMKETRTKTRACLTTNTAKLSTECKSAMTEREAAQAAKKS
ncbi:MAG: hypothetical protein ABL904_22765, partial [Hyphomicrobiaceae bacterium]